MEDGPAVLDGLRKDEKTGLVNPKGGLSEMLIVAL